MSWIRRSSEPVKFRNKPNKDYDLDSNCDTISTYSDDSVRYVGITLKTADSIDSVNDVYLFNHSFTKPYSSTREEVVGRSLISISHEHEPEKLEHLAVIQLVSNLSS